jgi:hypothetical protein
MSAQDVLQAEITKAASAAIIESLRPLLVTNRDRLLRTLQPHEVEAMAVAAVSAYISERRKHDQTTWNPSLNDLWPDFMR